MKPGSLSFQSKQFTAWQLDSRYGSLPKGWRAPSHAYYREQEGRMAEIKMQEEAQRKIEEVSSVGSDR